MNDRSISAPTTWLFSSIKPIGGNDASRPTTKVSGSAEPVVEAAASEDTGALSEDTAVWEDASGSDTAAGVVPLEPQAAKAVHMTAAKSIVNVFFISFLLF